MGWHFLRVVDESRNVASSYENQLVCRVCYWINRKFNVEER